MLVAAMLAPQRSEHPQLYLVGFTVQALYDQVVFGAGQGDFVKYILAHRHASPKERKYAEILTPEFPEGEMGFPGYRISKAGYLTTHGKGTPSTGSTLPCSRRK